MKTDYWDGMDMTRDEFWQGMRDEGCMLVDAPSRKAAAYASNDGQVVVAIEDGDAVCITAFCVDEIRPLVSALLMAEHDARPKDALINAQYDTHCAIEKAKEAK